MNKLMIVAVAIIIGISGFGCSDDDDNKDRTSGISDKQKVVERLKSIETGDTSSNAYMNPDKYIQHNLTIEDGHAGFEKLMELLPPPNSAKVNTVRVFQDGDYVVAHTDYDFFGPTIGIDIFRFESGLIVEHWDNLQKKEETNNLSGRSMVDGVTKIEDLEKTGENKALAGQFVQDVLIGKNRDRLSNYFDGNNCIQHNPFMSDGVSEFLAALGEMKINYERIHKILGEGNFVLVISEGTYAEENTSFYDLFRLSKGKIVEHWDVVEAIPLQSEWKNQNGKFNFPY